MNESQSEHPHGESAKETLLRLSADILHAICTHDGPKLATYLSADFVLLGSGERQNRDTFLESVSNADFHVFDRLFEIIDVELFGNTAVVSGIQRVTVRGDGEMSIVSRAAFTDVFVNQDTNWLLRVACSHELACDAGHSDDQ